MPSVEALIVSFNTRDLLRDCLASLLAHQPEDGAELRAAVWDNASRDGSADMVASEFPQVRLVRSSENLGFGAANDALAASSTADYLLLLNSDTVTVEDIISPLRAVLDADPAIAITSPRLEFPSGEVQYSSLHFPNLRYEAARTFQGTPLGRVGSSLIRRIEQTDLTHLREPRDTDFAWATCWLLRRGDRDLTPIFDSAFPMYVEDLDACRRLHGKGRRVVYVPGARLIHLGGASSPSRERFKRLRNAQALYFRRHHGRLAAGIYRLVKLPSSSALAQRLLGR